MGVFNFGGNCIEVFRTHGTPLMQSGKTFLRFASPATIKCTNLGIYFSMRMQYTFKIVYLMFLQTLNSQSESQSTSSGYYMT